MSAPGTQRRGGGPVQAGVRPGALSTLLEELVRAPDAAGGGDLWEEALRPGAVIGRFELVRELGRGGFGVVWEARDRELGRTVAFKAVQLGARPEVREERLLREAEAAARLSHPNIVTLYDVGRSEHGPYLVLELLRGRTLAGRLDQGPVTVREALRIAVEVAKGLAHAHAQGVIHRDLTPGNVFLCDDGQVKILDFGMAHAFGRRKLEGGTPAYMAPEQGRGAPEDERTDVFALGVILYRMLAGELPFADGGPRSVLGSRPAPALEIAEQPALGPLVAAMLERDPVRRPRDAAAVLATLASLEQEVARTPSSGSSGAAVRRARPSTWKRAALAAAILLALGLIGAVLAGRQRPAAASPSIAVLPFADLSPQKDQEYFSDGLSEEILNALAQLDGLQVAGRTSSFAFKDKNEDLRTIGQKLNVSAVLEGSVRKAGNRVRITAQLIRLPEGYHLWSQSFDRELTDIFAVQGEIARAVADALKVKLLPAAAAAARQPRSTNPEAYNHYLLARQFYAQSSPQNLRRAAAEFRKSVELEPSFAPAWAGLAIVLHYVGGMDAQEHGHHRISKDDPAQREALAAAERSIALAPELAEGYSVRGYLRGVLRWDWEGYREDTERALRLSPGDPTILRRYAILQSTLGRPEESLRYARRATEIDPLFASNWVALSEGLLETGQYDEARAAVLRALDIAPEYEDLKSMLAAVALVRGNPADAMQQAAETRDEKLRLSIVATAGRALGQVRESQRALDTLVARYGAEKPSMIASIYAWRGERDRAFEWLERAVAEHDDGCAGLKSNLLLKPLRGDPRFAEILRKANLPVD